MVKKCHNYRYNHFYVDFTCNAYLFHSNSIYLGLELCFSLLKFRRIMIFDYTKYVSFNAVTYSHFLTGVNEQIRGNSFRKLGNGDRSKWAAAILRQFPHCHHY